MIPKEQALIRVIKVYPSRVFHLQRTRKTMSITYLKNSSKEQFPITKLLESYQNQLMNPKKNHNQISQNHLKRDLVFQINRKISLRKNKNRILIYKLIKLIFCCHLIAKADEVIA